MKKPNSITEDLGIFGIFFEIISKIIELLFKLLVKHWKQYRKRNHFVNYKEPITTKQLHCKKLSNHRYGFGWLTNNSMDFKYQYINTKRHTLLIGPSGYGKTNLLTLFQERASMLGNTLVFFDPKNSFESQMMFKEACLLSGKEAMFFTDDSDNFFAFNPVAEGSINQICDRIINSCTWSDSYYKGASIAALIEALEYLESQHEVITLQKIEDLLQKRSDKSKIDGLLNQLTSVNKSAFSKLINIDDHNIKGFSKKRLEGKCLYFGISSLSYRNTADFFNKIIMDNLLYHCADALKIDSEIENDRSTMTVFFDELSSILTPQFIDLQNKCRAADIEIISATQALSDFSRVSDQVRDQFIENTENLFIFNQRVPGHTEYFSKLCGTKTTKKITQQIENSSSTGMGTSREVEEYRVHPNIIRNLKIGQCIYIDRKDDYIDLLNIRKHVKNYSLNKEDYELNQKGTEL